MKKKYIMPQITVAEIAIGQQLLAGSTPGYGGGSGATPHSRDFYFNDAEEI